jgi:2'-5' RNA ligase
VIARERSDKLEQLAADCVTAFDPFRAPLTPDDRARRNPQRLTPRQVEYLDRWGYPYVMEEFRFHMTLTGRLDETRRQGVIAMLRERLARLGLGELAIDRIALFRQDDAEMRFGIIGDWQLHVA